MYLVMNVQQIVNRTIPYFWIREPSALTIPGPLRFALVQVLGTKLSPLPFRLVSTAIRIGNNVIGGISFVLLAKILGVQSSKGDEIVAEHEGVEPA